MSSKSPYQFPFPPFSNSQFETQQTPTDSQNSPRSQVPAFSNPNFIDLNDDCEETEDVREITGQWKWVEDNLLISAWLNVSIDPLVGTDQKAKAFWERIHQYCEEDNPGVIKRGVVVMKKSHSGNYSSSGNNDTPTNENVVESPVRPQGTKAAKRRGKGKARTVEADEEYEELRAYAFAGSNNDINVLDRSPVFDEVLQGCAPESRFAIVRGPARFWDKADLGKIMRACIIIHNIIVEDEGDTYATQFGPLPIYDDAANDLSQPDLGEEPFIPYETYIQNTLQMRDKRTHRQLQNDLVEHITQFHYNR
ncbi:uncharacterized protein LOC141719912 [Apium graveolens]|uniref:uncharacterized protein LOC141719912 n=1 Tax=Apium graveolens TaxID=4045 RepID=UPI003D7AE9E2